MQMFPEAEQSATLKQKLKKEPANDSLRQMAERHPLEADEAIMECEKGSDSCIPFSWVWEQMTNAR